jgi:hypothetical protein
LHSIKAYFTVNAMVYNTNEKKVIITLTYMMEGTASSWSDMFYQVCEGRTAKYTVAQQSVSIFVGFHVIASL